MNEKVGVELGPVQETLLIPLLGRAAETKRKRGIINDQKAVEIVESLDYDFSKWEGIPSLIGASIRTKIFDEHVKQFLKQFPQGTIVELGVGLNTRYERLDNQIANWIEIDLPDTMALRRKFFKNTKRRHQISASFVETNWYDQVASFPGPYCFVSEAVIIYLEEAILKKSIRKLVKSFPGSWLITDTTSSEIVTNQDTHDAMSTMPKESWFKWRCDEPRSLFSWGLVLKQSQTFMDAPAEVRKSLPWRFRLILFLFPGKMRKKVQGYRINRFQLKITFEEI